MQKARWNFWLALERADWRDLALGVALAAILATLAVRATAATLTPQTPPFLASAQKSTHLSSDGVTKSHDGSGDHRAIIYSDWTKVCQKGGAATARVCFIGKTAHIELGEVVAVLIERAGETKKILRVTLPLGMDLRPGTSIVVDNGKPMNAPYVACENSGCIAEFKANTELIDQLKRGQGLGVQAINNKGQVVSLALPLADFGKAYDGAPTDSH